MTFEAFLQAVTDQARLHGRDQLKPMTDPRQRTIGFTSPSGTWAVPLATLNATFTGPLRENTELMENYRRFGGTTPIHAMTRKLPPNEVGAAYASKVKAAIDEGERLRALH